METLTQPATQAIANEEHEMCAVCNCLTDVKRTTPVDQRQNYVECCGQLCPKCYTMIYE